MDIFYNIHSIKSKFKYYKSKNFKIGLVPTMGALHQGHISLIRKSLEENEITCCSIYVNPSQFNNPNDLAKYPKTLETDIKLLDDAGCSAVFIPEDKEMYPSKPSLSLFFGDLGNTMEGKFRPGHFNGVGIIVAKLFNIIEPDHAYFGQKDLQQFLIIKQMVKDLTFDLELKSVPIQRDIDGLAMSSRNTRLTPAERRIAPKIYEALTIGRDALRNSFSISDAKDKVRTFLNQITEIKLEYFEVADAETLSSLEELPASTSIALCIAAYVGEVRLIDNLLFNS